MTTLAPRAVRAAAPDPIRPVDGSEVAGLLRSEWTKLRSLRSTVWALSLLVLLDLGFTALFTTLGTTRWSHASAAQKQAVLTDPTSTILGAGLELSQLAICVLGVLVIAGEYASGTIRVSLLAVPRRTPMLAAKSAVFFALVFVVGELAAFPSFFLGAAILRRRVHVSLTDPGVLRSVVGAGLYLALLGVLAIGVGALLRHTAAGVTAVIGFVLVLEPLSQLLPGDLGANVHAVLPSSAGSLITSAHQGPDELLSPWQGYGVLVLWTVLVLTAAAVLLKRRDA